MENIEDKSIDATITDPVWPNNTLDIFKHIDPEKLFCYSGQQVARISKRIAIQLGIDSDPRMLLGIPKEIPFIRACWLPYAFPQPKGRILYSGDIAYLFGIPPKPSPGNKIIPGWKWATNNKGNRSEHPCSRKLEHVLWLIAKFTIEGEIVLDPFIGSGKTAIACEIGNRQWIGIEIEEKYCEVAARDIEKEAKQEKFELKTSS